MEKGLGDGGAQHKSIGQTPTKKKKRGSTKCGPFDCETSIISLIDRLIFRAFGRAQSSLELAVVLVRVCFCVSV